MQPCASLLNRFRRHIKDVLSEEELTHGPAWCTYVSQAGSAWRAVSTWEGQEASPSVLVFVISQNLI